MNNIDQLIALFLIIGVPTIMIVAGIFKVTRDKIRADKTASNSAVQNGNISAQAQKPASGQVYDWATHGI